MDNNVKKYTIDSDNFDEEYNNIYNKANKYAKKNKLILVKINSNSGHNKVTTIFEDIN